MDRGAGEAVEVSVARQLRRGVGWRGGLVWVTLVWVGGVISQVSQALSRSRSGSRAGSDVPLGLDFCRLAFFFSSGADQAQQDAAARVQGQGGLMSRRPKFEARNCGCCLFCCDSWFVVCGGVWAAEVEPRGYRFDTRGED